MWRHTPPERLWKLDKLLLALHLGYRAGPAGLDVPEPGEYIVRPCVNALGMGQGAARYVLLDTTDHLPPGTFWCQWFTGQHLTVDYVLGRAVLVAEGLPDTRQVGRFLGWRKLPIERAPPLPAVLEPEPGRVNAEFIGGRVVEVHLRPNPDFRWGNVEARPVWAGEHGRVPKGWRFEHAPDGERIGFLVR